MGNVTIPIPEWSKEMRIRIFIGRESYMVREPDGTWYKKTVRCNLCGKCCKNPTINWHLGTKEINGEIYCSKVNKVNEEYFCEAGSKAPFSCCSELPKNHPNDKDCIIEYEKIEV